MKILLKIFLGFVSLIVFGNHRNIFSLPQIWLLLLMSFFLAAKKQGYEIKHTLIFLKIFGRELQRKSCNNIWIITL